MLTTKGIKNQPKLINDQIYFYASVAKTSSSFKQFRTYFSTAINFKKDFQFEQFVHPLTILKFPFRSQKK